MIPSIKTLHADTLKGLLGIFFDIDDTLTTHGKIRAIAYRALWELKDSGLRALQRSLKPYSKAAQNEISTRPYPFS